MKFTINIKKKHFYLLAVMISVLGIFTVFAATSFNSSNPLHPLQQVTIDQNGATSVDANSNAIIDNADKLQGLSASEFCRTNGVNCPGSGVWTISGSDISFAGDLQADSITLGGETRTSWTASPPPELILIWSTPVSGGFVCDSYDFGGQLSGECSPEGDTNNYNTYEWGGFCGSGDKGGYIYINGESLWHMSYTQTCIAS